MADEREAPDQERITGVAILTEDGRLFALPRPNRHGNLFALADFHGQDGEPSVQGFMTNRGRFVDRKEAMSIACQTNGPWRSVRPDRPELFSEDLW